MTNGKTSQWSQPWFIRKIAYAAIALILLIAVGAGWITDAQSNSLLSQADQILAALGLILASVKTNPQSDTRPESIPPFNIPGA